MSEDPAITRTIIYNAEFEVEWDDIGEKWIAFSSEPNEVQLSNDSLHLLKLDITHYVKENLLEFRKIKNP